MKPDANNSLAKSEQEISCVSDWGQFGADATGQRSCTSGTKRPHSTQMRGKNEAFVLGLESNRCHSPAWAGQAAGVAPERS